MVALSRRKFEDVMELVKTYMFDDVFSSDFAEDIMRKAAINLIELKNAGVREISIFTTKIKGCFESYVIMDFIEDDEDIRLGTGESIESDVENIYPDEMVYLKEKRAYRRN